MVASIGFVVGFALDNIGSAASEAARTSPLVVEVQSWAHWHQLRLDALAVDWRVPTSRMSR